MQELNSSHLLEKVAKYSYLAGIIDGESKNLYRHLAIYKDL